MAPGEKRRRGIGTGGDAGAASDAGGRIHRQIRILFRNGNRVAVRRAARGNRNESPGGNDSVERAAIHDQIPNNRKCLRAPRLEIEDVPVLEVPHVELADRRAGLRAVRNAVDHETARSADSFAAIVVEGDGLFALAR